MTKEQFEKAGIIEKQILSINALLDKLLRCEYKCEPMIRCSGIRILRSDRWDHDLTEGEIMAIIDALECMKTRLKIEFENL